MDIKTMLIIGLAVIAFKIILYNNYGCTGMISCNLQGVTSVQNKKV